MEVANGVRCVLRVLGSCSAGCSVCSSVFWRRWRASSVCWRLEVAIYALEMPEGMRRVLLRTPEAAEGELRSPEVLEMICWMLLCMLEAVDGGLCLLEALVV